VPTFACVLLKEGTLALCPPYSSARTAEKQLTLIHGDDAPTICEAINPRQR
jgi:hypothetical protein